MSRSLTSAQIIALGEYLEPDFEAGSLTVSQLLGIFGYHNIKYPAPYTKPKLVQLFNDEVKPKSKKFKKERLKRENSVASDDGIKDGLTGRYINDDALPLRRSSRRSSRAPSQDSEIAPQPQPKRRRSSAKPDLGGPSKQVPPPQSPVMEESEPEESEEDVPVRKVSKGKKKVCFGRGASSATYSGWEDNNIFQSGAESSSPVRPSPTKPRATRKSNPPKVVTRRSSRKAESAPPEMPSSPSPFKPAISTPGSPFKTPISPFKSPVSRPSLVHQETPSFVKDARDDEDADVSKVEADDEASGVPDEEVAEEGEEQVEESEAKQTNAVTRRIADTSTAIVQRVQEPTSGMGRKSLSAMILFIAVSLLSLVPYKQESSSIGFCDPGLDTNEILEGLRTRRVAAEECAAENRTLLYITPVASASSSAAIDQPVCPPPALIPIPSPNACTPCPEHAQCSHNNIVCDSGYIIRPHPVLGFLPFPMTNSLNSPLPSLQPIAPTRAILSGVSTVFDGLPGFGPVAFPPHCVVDPRRKKHIGVLGKAVEAVLGQERGKRLCAGDTIPVKDENGGEAKRWGLEISALKEAMKKKTAPQLMDTFDDTFDEAIEQLLTWGGVFTRVDTEGHKFIAHNTPDLDWACALTVKSREGWQEWRLTLGGILTSFIALLYGRNSLRQRAIDNKRAAELVQIVLDTLRNQEVRHYTDPVSEPHPYISSVQLRDQILQDEHSVKKRQYLWDKVERVVEGNANVRANLEEVEGGDELRVWRWVGGGARRKTLLDD
ncbi:uncharacterized protein STEHIDRAFT_51002 [Stereum hirsutum FP-91666 SS1]|uniref:uncharacterized protein n=1 Tax=Stereum hirsutum (strain FP-91666) TaxID=721885 RepID=UPI000440DA64|nr:uncharacterized protein STEHIDRAFT_51002 [Stereum hirsutum FP-91666 SS1]EIM89882.1 hypothetical protein STEHIDRAFT_51002 [Stereum hirsutum FP-91666 SS1]